MATPLTLWLFGDIGSDVRSQPIVEKMAAFRDQDLILRINSGGGSVFEANAIFNAAREHRGTVRVLIDGLAASSASYIAMAGDVVEMAENALMMVHAPWSSRGGNAKDLRQSAEVLDRIATSMRRAYSARSGLSDDEIAAIMAAETWYDANEAKATGFIDEITGPVDVAAHFDPEAFCNSPAHIRTRLQAMADPKSADSGAPQTGRDNSQAKTVSIDDFKAAENRRRTDIRNAFRGFRGTAYGVEDLEQRCIDDMQCSVEAARTQLLNKLGEGAEPLGGGMAMLDDGSAPYGSFQVGSRGRDDGFRAAVTDGILMRYGMTVKRPHAAARDFRGASIRDIARASISRAGKRLNDEGPESLFRAAQTTSDFPAILENVAQKSLIIGLESEGATTHRGTWTRRGSLSDFKNASRVALSEAPDLEHVPEASEIKDGAITDKGKETIHLETYARIVSISRQALINDDLDQLTRTPQALGLSAARKESDLVYRLLADNPEMRDGQALFDAEHGNTAAAGSAVTIESLGQARAAMRKQRGAGGLSYLNVTPAFLIVGADRETEALQVLSDIEPNRIGDAVPEWMRRLTVVVDPRIDDFAEGAWFLSGDPNVHDTFEVAFLDGRTAPDLQQEEHFDTLNMRWRVVMDMGVAALDWRGLYKNAGA